MNAGFEMIAKSTECFLQHSWCNQFHFIPFAQNILCYELFAKHFFFTKKLESVPITSRSIK